MLKDEILGDQIPRHRRNWFALVYCSSVICALLLPFSQLFMTGASFAHSNTYKDTSPPFWHPAPSPFSVVTLQNLASTHLVTADMNASGLLRTFVDNPGPWERFDIFQRGGDNVYALRAEDNGHFVSTRLDASGMLMALATTISTWEEFEINGSDGTNGPSAQFCVIKSIVNNDYVSTRLDDERKPLMALSTNTNTNTNSWEEFLIIPVKQ